MCKGIVLFFISFGIVNNCYALTFTGVKDSVENFAPNIATIDDIRQQPSNVASIFDDSVFVDVNSKNDVKIVAKNVAAVSENSVAIEKEKNIKSSEKDFAKLEEIKDEKKNEEKFVEIPEKKVARNIKKNVKKIKGPFDDLKVDDGKEILVSMSIPENYRQSANEIKKKVEKKVAKKYKKRKKNFKKNMATSITEPIIYDKQIILADSIKSKSDPIFPILSKPFKKEENEIVDVSTSKPVVAVEKENKKSFSNFDSTEIVKSLDVLQKKENLKKNRDIAYINYGNEIKNNPFVKAFSALRPEKVDNNKLLSSISPQKQKREKTVAFVPSSVLKDDLKRTYLSDNKYLSPVESVDADDEEYDDEIEDKEETTDAKQTEIKDTEEKQEESEKEKTVDVEKVKERLKSLKKEQSITGSLKVSGREVLHMKIEFDKKSSALSSESINLLRSFGQIVVDKPTNSIEISIPMTVMNSIDKKKLTARRLAIVANVLRNTGISEKQINPVLSNRDENSFAFRIISNDKIIQHKVSGGKDIMGDETNSKVYDLMKW